MASPTLGQTLDTTTALITHLQNTLKTASSPTPNTGNKPINPLALASTAASLIKAQTTKLTLLALNKPFTPSPIVQILHTISTSPLPALITAVQICEPAKFSNFAHHELKNKSIRLLKAYQSLIDKIPATEAAQESKILVSKVEHVSGSDDLGQKAALIGTGMVWEVCDEIIALAEQGVGEAAAKRMVNFRALFNDASEEINGWVESGTNPDDLDIGLEDLKLGDGVSDASSLGSFSSRPSKDILPIADWVLTILNHLALLYPPLIKRRIKKFPDLNSKTSMDTVPSKYVLKLDQILSAGQFWSEQIDQVAEALFENEGDTAIGRVNEIVGATETYLESVRYAWDGTEDELTAWLMQWSKKLSDIQVKDRPLI